MKSEILLRAFTAEGLRYMDAIKNAIETHTGLVVTPVDHSQITLESFNVKLGENLVTIDRFLADKLQIPYFRISRVFRSDGTVSRRIRRGTVFYRGPNIRVLDTDIVKGETIKMACEIFGTDKYDAPLRLQDHQDLIDIEDLITENSFREIETYISRRDGLEHPATKRYHPIRCSYMLNETFFAERTSLPKELYQVIKDIIS